MNDWSGEERRVVPYEYDFRKVIRDELRPIQEKQEELFKAQTKIERKISDWESGAKWFRVFIISTVGLASMGAAAWEWAKAHVK